MTDTAKNLLVACLLLISSSAFTQHYYIQRGFETDSRHIADLCFFQEGKKLAVTDHASVRVFSSKNGDMTNEFTGGHDARILSIAVSPAGLWMATGDITGRIVIRDTRTGEITGSINQGSSAIVSLDFHPDGSRLLVGSAGGTVSIMDPASGKILKEISDHTLDVTDVSFNRDGSRFATAAGDGLIYLYDSDDYSAITSLAGHESWVRALEFNSSGNKLYSSGDDANFVKWNLSDLAGKTTSEVDKIGRSWITCLDVHPDDDVYALGNLHGIARIITPFESLDYRLKYPVNQVAFFPGNLNFFRLAVGTEGGGLRIIDARDMVRKK